MSKHLHKLFALVLVCCAFLGSSNAWAQVNLQQSPYTENFDGMTTSYPTGWNGLRLSGSGTAGAVLTPIETDGNANSGAVYSVGTTTERALGTLASGSTVPVFGASFMNNTGGMLNQISVSAVAEQWKTGKSATDNESIIFEYSLDATSLDDPDATWTAEAGLNLNEILTSMTDNIAVDGNAEANRIPFSAQLSSLNWAEGTTLWIRWKDTNDDSNDGMYAVDDVKIEFESNSTAPAIFAPSTLNLGEVLVNGTASADYTFTAVNLVDGVTVTATAPYLVSKTVDGTYASEVTYAPAELEAEGKVYVTVTPTTLGSIAGTITHTSTDATDVVISATVMSHSPYAQEFDNCTGTETLTGGWMQYSVSGDQNWACTKYGETGNAIQMSGYGDSSNNVDWLISPAMDLTEFTLPVLSLNYRTKFTGDALVIKVSTNYTGTGDPNAATWANLATLPANEADEWMLLNNVDLSAYKAAGTYIGIIYTSTIDESTLTTDEASRWTIDNFEVSNVTYFVNTGNLNLHFPETAAGQVSEAQQFTFSAVGFSETVTVTAPAGFKLSKDGTEFASSLTYTSEEAAADNTVYSRFAPSETSVLSSGPVTFTSGDITITKGILSGSSLLKATTLDVVTWNMKWFGSTSHSPDDALQFENAKKVIQHLDADIIGVQEVADNAKIEKLAEATGYTYITKPVAGQQQIGFLYKADVVTVKKDKVLLSKLFKDIKEGTTNLTDYPTNEEYFWASGRLPYLVQFEATIDGIKQTINVVNLHAKANSDATRDTDYARRVYDAKVLKDSLDVHYGTANLILLGDFNDDVDVSVVGTNQPSSFDVFVKDNVNYNILTYDLSLAGAITYETSSFQSFLDHIFISDELNNEYVSSSINVENRLLDLIPDFRNNTSDHMPVSARFTLTATPFVTFSEASVSKTEDAGTFTVSLTVSEAIATEQTIKIAARPGATASASDYTIVGATDNVLTLTLPANETAATFEVTITDDTDTEGSEQVTFGFTSLSSGLEAGTADAFTLTIEDNDAPTGIADATKGQFSVYPTLVNNGNVSLMLPERIAATATINMVVYSIEGRKVMQVSGTQSAVQSKLNSNLPALTSGMYILLVETGKEYFQTKMVKQ